MLKCEKYTKWPKKIPNEHKLYHTTTNYTKRPYVNYTKWPQTIPQRHKIQQTTINYTKLPEIIPSCHKIYKQFSFLRPSKIYPNWDFRIKNKPSGNPGSYPKSQCLRERRKTNLLLTQSSNMTVFDRTVLCCYIYVCMHTDVWWNNPTMHLE
jgi:hypothetical protein